jgi:hypothetical protein
MKLRIGAHLKNKTFRSTITHTIKQKHMKKTIGGILLMNILIFEPILGWYITSRLGMSDGWMSMMGFLGVMSILFQMAMAALMILSGYKEQGIITEI